MPCARVVPAQCLLPDSRFPLPTPRVYVCHSCQVAVVDVGGTPTVSPAAAAAPKPAEPAKVRAPQLTCCTSRRTRMAPV